jgi:hypothetical protein
MARKKVSTPKLHAERVKLNRQGYTKDGRYFGVGEKVWRVTDDAGILDEHVRAPTQKEAKAKLTQRAFELLARAHSAAEQHAKRGSLA